MFFKLRKFNRFFVQRNKLRKSLKINLLANFLLGFFLSLIKFQKYGNQNNIWNEAHFNIEELQEDFQILFVAKSGRGQLSDIAVDDVKLLTGDDCRALNRKGDEGLSNEEYDSTTYESIYEMQSCVGHCFEYPGTGIIRQFKQLKGLCNCDIDCEDNETCCPDFRAVCLNELFSESTPIAEANDATQKIDASKNNSTTALSTTSTKIRVTRTTSMKTTPTTSTTTTTKKPIPTSVKTTPTSTQTTPRTTITSPSPRPAVIKTTRSSTIPTTPPTTTTRNTTPTTTKRRTSLATPATPAIYTRKTTAQIITTLKTTPSTTSILTTSHVRTTPAKTSPDPTSTRRPLPSSNSIEYVIIDKAKKENKGSYSVLLYTLFLIVVLVLAVAVYKRFGDRAVAWYMIRFKHNTQGDLDSSSVTTSLKQPEGKTNRENGTSKNTWRNKVKKSSSTKNIMKARLTEYDDEDDDDDTFGANGNIALKNNIYTEL